MASPIFPSLFLLLACLGSVARAITGKLHHLNPPHCSTEHVLGNLCCLHGTSSLWHGIGPCSSSCPLLFCQQTLSLSCQFQACDTTQHFCLWPRGDISPKGLLASPAVRQTLMPCHPHPVACLLSGSSLASWLMSLHASFANSFCILCRSCSRCHTRCPHSSFCQAEQCS